MPDMSERRIADAWENMQRRTDFVDIEDAFLGVMADAQAKGELPGQAPPPAGLPMQQRESPVCACPGQPASAHLETCEWWLAKWRVEQLGLDLSVLGIEGSETVEGAMTDLMTFAEFSDVTLTVDGDLFSVFGVQLNKDHSLALLRVWNAFQASTDERETEQLGQALWDVFTELVQGIYWSLRGDDPR